MSLDCERSGRFGDFLREHAALPEETLEAAIRHQQQFGGRIGTCLLEIGAVELEELAGLLARFHKCPPAPADWLEQPDEQALRVLPLSLIRRCNVLPMRLEPDRLHVASMDPSDGALAQELEVTALRDVSVYLLPEVRLMYWLEVHLGIDRHPRFVNLAARARSAGAAAPGDANAPHGAGNLPPTDATTSGARAAGPSVGPEARASAGAGGGASAASDRVSAVAKGAGQAANTGAGHGANAAAGISASANGGANANAGPDKSASTGASSGVNAGPGGDDRSAHHAQIGEHWRRRIAAHEPTERELLLEDILLEDASEADAPSDPHPHPRDADWPGPRGLAELEAALEGAGSRDGVADAALALAQCFAEAVGLLIVRDGSVRGFCARGEGIGEAIREFEVPIDGPMSRNTLMTLPVATHSPFRGCPPPDGLDRLLLDALGRPGAREILVHPVRLRGRVLNLLYADNGSAPLGETQVAALRQVCISLANAYERLLLKSQHRT